MSRGRIAAVAASLLIATTAAAGCGLGAGKDVGEVGLTVTRDFGAHLIVGPRRVEAREADTAMRVLEREAEIDTRYGGGFVQSIDGLAGNQGQDGPSDWFYYVNGVEATVGAADYSVHGGESIWWDYRDWSATPHVPAVVGSWPEPFRDGYDGSRRRVVVECLGGGSACHVVRERLAAAGAPLGSGGSDGALRVLVGPWARLRRDPAAAQLERGPQASGVYARIEGDGPRARIEALDGGGRPARGLGPRAGIVAATRRYDEPPTWLVTGPRKSGALAAARLLSAAALRDRFAVATEDGVELPLPVR